MSTKMLSIASFVLFTGAFLSPLFRSIINVREYEIKRYEEFKVVGTWRKMKEGMFISFIVGSCSLVAATHAALKPFWFIVGFIYLFSGIIAILVTVARLFIKIDTLKSTPTLSEDILEKNIRKRKKIWVGQILLLAIWLYSWKGLLI